jgi:hypothetical protein
LVCRLYNNGDGGNANYASDYNALAMQRLDEYFARDSSNLASVDTCGLRSEASAIEKMRAKLQAFDEIFYNKEKNKEGEKK